MKGEDKYALIASAFIPWILTWVLSYGFNGPDAWRTSIQFVGPMWVIVSPLITLFLFKLCVGAAREK
jgi:hypothetical protein